jgi:crossover junction endodeoxyribonuclease RuvC
LARLALDLGTTAGFGMSPSKGVIVSGSWDLRPKKYEGAGRRYVRFREQLDRMHAKTPIDIIWFEAVRRHLGTDAAHVYGGLMATLEAWCEDNGVPYEGVPVQTIKKFWTGKGNASKQEMMARALQRGHNPIDDNECDAVALLVFKDPDAEGLEMPRGPAGKPEEHAPVTVAPSHFATPESVQNSTVSKNSRARQLPGLKRGPAAA